MKQVSVVKVDNLKALRRFVHFPNQLYKNNIYYVPQIESMDLSNVYGTF